MNNFFKIDINIEEYEELEFNYKNIKDIRNSLVGIYTSYYHISDYVHNLKKFYQQMNLRLF